MDPSHVASPPGSPHRAVPWCGGWWSPVHTVRGTGGAGTRWGEVPVAVAVLRGSLGSAPSTEAGLAGLDEFLTARLARYKHPKALEVVDALPRNPAGKVLKIELRARFGAAASIDALESYAATTVSAGRAQQLPEGGRGAHG